MKNTRTRHLPHWKPLQKWPYDTIALLWRQWLGDTGSLTERLVRASHGNFDVKILSQKVGLPQSTEAQILGLQSRQWAMVREVLLYGNGTPWVYARSVLPLTTLTGRLKPLRHLDNRPLGMILFNDNSMARGPVEVARIPTSTLPMALPEEILWGRRSVFRLDDKPLLVSEIFLPTFDPREHLGLQ